MVPVHRYMDLGSSFATQLNDVQTASNAAGNIPIWLTEFGLLNAGKKLANGQFMYARSTRDSVAFGIIAQVYRAIESGTIPNLKKAFYYRLWDNQDDDSTSSMLSTAQINGTFSRRDAWHMYRQFALHGGPDWQPVVRWWRQADGKWGTDPNESTAGGYSKISNNSWSTSIYQYGTTESGSRPPGGTRSFAASTPTRRLTTCTPSPSYMAARSTVAPGVSNSRTGSSPTFSDLTWAWFHSTGFTMRQRRISWPRRIRPKSRSSRRQVDGRGTTSSVTSGPQIINRKRVSWAGNSNRGQITWYHASRVRLKT